MDLFELANNRVIPSAHALIIEPFKGIWENDRSAHKIESIKIFSYVELLCSPRKSNPFAGYSEEDRPKKVKKEIFGSETPDINDIKRHDIMSATMKYRELLSIASPSYDLYVSAFNAVQKLRKFLDGFSLNERNERTGNMVLKPKDITSALKELPDVEKTMQSYRDKIQGELNDSIKTRNQRMIGLFER